MLTVSVLAKSRKVSPAQHHFFNVLSEKWDSLSLNGLTFQDQEIKLIGKKTKKIVFLKK